MTSFLWHCKFNLVFYAWNLNLTWLYAQSLTILFLWLNEYNLKKNYFIIVSNFIHFIIQEIISSAHSFKKVEKWRKVKCFFCQNFIWLFFHVSQYFFVHLMFLHWFVLNTQHFLKHWDFHHLLLYQEMDKKVSIKADIHSYLWRAIVVRLQLLQWLTQQQNMDCDNTFVGCPWC